MCIEFVCVCVILLTMPFVNVYFCLCIEKLHESENKTEITNRWKLTSWLAGV